MGDLALDQRGLVKAILMEAASMTPDEGYDELEQALNADDFLIANTGEAGFSSLIYHIAFLGTPVATPIPQILHRPPSPHGPVVRGRAARGCTGPIPSRLPAGIRLRRAARWL